MGLGTIGSESNDACVEVWMRDNDGRPLCLIEGLFERAFRLRGKQGWRYH